MPHTSRLFGLSLSLALVFGLGTSAYAAQAMITTGQYTVPAQVISIKNMAAVKTVEARNIQTIPKKASFKVKGSAVCPNGSDIKTLQVMLGTALPQGGGKPNLAFTSQPANIPDAGYGTMSTNFEYTYEPGYAVNNQKIAVDLQPLNPARNFENLRIQYQNNGGNVVQYLREDQIFDMTTKLTLYVECENPNTQARVYGVHETSGKTTVMYQGDPLITGATVPGPGQIQGYQPPPPPPTPGYQPAAPTPTPAELPKRAPLPTRTLR